MQADLEHWNMAFSTVIYWDTTFVVRVDKRIGFVWLCCSSLSSAFRRFVFLKCMVAASSGKSLSNHGLDYYYLKYFGVTSQ